MTKVMKIKGMMCSNCEKHVKVALESLPNVTATVDHQKGIATVTITDESVKDQDLIDAVTKAGYEVKKIK